MSYPHSFGYWLRLKRKALDLTREALAQRVGCSAATIRKLETEERRPSEQIVERLAEIFEIHLSERPSFLKFARGNISSAPSETLAEIPWQPTSVSNHLNLPATVTSLVGRNHEIEYVRSYLLKKEIRLVTLVGPPGIGKTRLGLEAARASQTDFPDGVFFAALAPLDDPSLVAPAIVQALGFAGARNLSASQQLIEGIGEKRILLVVDNCEHLIDEVAQQASQLLLACPNLNILATSRESLRIPGEWLYTVPALEVPRIGKDINMESVGQFPALTLFTERAQAVRSDFTLNPGNLQAVASICALLDGLPLAIELLAARIRLMSPQALLERMNEQFILSADGMRAVAVRQKTLKNAIGWSFDVLSPEEQKIFTHLAVFSGGFTLPVVETVMAGAVAGRSVTEIVTSLSDKSLLQRTLDAHGETRFNMLVTIRQFALDSLRRNGDETWARNAHCAYFLAFAEKGEQEMRGPLQAVWGDLVNEELDDFRAALEWSVSEKNTESALRLLYAVGWPWEVHGRYTETRDWFERIRLLPDAVSYTRLYVGILNHIGRQSWTQQKFQEARTFLEESRTICLGIGAGSEQLLAETLNWLGMAVLLGDEDGDTARSMLSQGLGLYKALGDDWGSALSLFHLGIVESSPEYNAAARAYYEQSLATFLKFGDLFFIARVSLFLGYEFLKMGDYEQARHYFTEHLRIDQDLHFWDGIADGWRDLGYLARVQGDFDQAERYYEESLAVSSRHGLHNSDTLYHLGLLALIRDNYGLAHARFTHPLKLTQKIDERTRAGIFLIGLAAVAGGINQPERAARLYGAGLAQLETSKQRISQVDQTEFARHIQMAREQLGEDRFETLASAGQAMQQEQAIDYALSQG